MKAYVNFAKTEPVDESKPFHRPRLIVQYSHTPEHWQMNQNEAQLWCDDLNDGDVHSVKFPEHRCCFEIEEIALGVFEILCVDHPEFEESSSS